MTASDTADALGDLSRVGADRLASWFAERELGFEAVVYAADPEPTEWTARVRAAGRSRAARRGVR